MGNQTPPRPPPRPLVPPPAPIRPRAAGVVGPRVIIPPLVFGNGSPPGGGPTRSRKQKQTRKQKQQKRKQQKTRKN